MWVSVSADVRDGGRMRTWELTAGDTLAVPVGRVGRAGLGAAAANVSGISRLWRRDGCNSIVGSMLLMMVRTILS